MPDHGDGLQILHDERHQRHEWLLEVAGWLVIALVLAAALAGYAGGGPASQAEAGQDGLRLAYDRYVRSQGAQRLAVHLEPGLAVGGRVRVWIQRSFVEGIQVEHIDPRPEAVEAHGERYVWVFLAPKGDVEPLLVTFRFLPDFVGRRDGMLGIDNGPEVGFRQFAFP